LLLRLAMLYLYGYGSKDIPWLILLVLAVSELYQRPFLGGLMAVVSLAVCLSPDRWWKRNYDINLDDLDGDFGDIEGF